MSEYTPTTNDVRSNYQSLIVSGKSDRDKENEFDRWLAEVVREASEKAWEEGFDAAELDVFEHEKHNWDNDCIPNPYAEETQ